MQAWGAQAEASYGAQLVRLNFNLSCLLRDSVLLVFIPRCELGYVGFLLFDELPLPLQLLALLLHQLVQLCVR
ncbi:MAG: hypothetical protein SGPRY_009495 [Prymnesium sp.]